MKHWAVSLALHGSAIGVASLIWFDPAPGQEPEPQRWQVSFSTSPSPQVPDNPRNVPTPSADTPPPLPAPATAELIPPSQEPPATPPSPDALPPQAVTPPVVPLRAEAPITSEPTTTTAPELSPSPRGQPAVPAVAPTAPPSAPRKDLANHAAEAERRWYLALVDKLRSMKRYPMAARRLGQEGVVMVALRIGPDGRLEGAEISRGSGYPLLDRDALRLVEAASEAARHELRPERATKLEIPIAYRLAQE